MATITGTGGADTLNGGSAADEISGLGGNDRLNGEGGNDTLIGGPGADRLNGGLGADSLVGGAGNDIYTIDATDVLDDSGGHDTVQAAFSYTLLSGFGDLVLLGNSAINGTGNELDNTLTGNIGNNLLNGGGGNDTLEGDSGSDTLEGSSGDDFLEGGSGSDTLIGGGGRDILDGSAGADSMVGGARNDGYHVSDASDVVTELVGEGAQDYIISTVSYTLPAEVEWLFLRGTANIDGTGNALDNLIDGNSGNNRLVGGGGNDTLYGFLGNDTFAGGAGDDTYYVHSASEVVTELVGEGAQDLINSTVTYTLPDEVEQLFLLNTANINGTGNTLDNTIVGNTGNNRLLGGAGDDLLWGLLGDDYLHGGPGMDAVLYALDAFGVTVDLAAGVASGGDGSDTLVSVESAAGSDYDDTLKGTGGTNELVGFAGNDTLDGGAGNDTLDGGAGNDRLTGRGGQDTFDFSDTLDAATNVDRVTDFVVIDDTIQLDRAIFTAIPAGTLALGRFYSALGATAAHDSTDRIVYNSDSDTGKLYYDADGVGGVDATLFATLTGAPTLTHADFLIVA